MNETKTNPRPVQAARRILIQTPMLVEALYDGYKIQIRQVATREANEGKGKYRLKVSVYNGSNPGDRLIFGYFWMYSLPDCFKYCTDAIYWRQDDEPGEA